MFATPPDQASVTGNAGTVTTIAGKLVAGTNTTRTGSGTTADPYVISSTAAGTGDVVGPAAAVNNNFAAFDTTTGKLIKDSGTNAAALAPLASPALTGNPTVPTQTAGDNDTSAASTAFVQTAVAGVSARPRVTSIVYNSVITANATTTDIVAVGTLTNNVTLAAPSGTPYDGQVLRYRITQDATGGRTVTVDNVFKRPSGVTLTWSTGANKRDLFAAVWNATSSTWDVLSLITGY